MVEEGQTKSTPASEFTDGNLGTGRLRDNDCHIIVVKSDLSPPSFVSDMPAIEVVRPSAVALATGAKASPIERRSLAI